MSEPLGRTARITRAEQAAERLAEATREGNELLRALQLERARARQDTEELVDKMLSTVRDVFEESVKSNMKVLGDHIEKTKTQAVKKIFAEFDKITSILMGREDQDEADLLETARLYRSVHDLIQEEKRSVVPDFWRRPQ